MNKQETTQLIRKERDRLVALLEGWRSAPIKANKHPIHIQVQRLESICSRSGDSQDRLFPPASSIWFVFLNKTRGDSGSASLVLAHKLDVSRQEVESWSASQVRVKLIAELKSWKGLKLKRLVDENRRRFKKFEPASKYGIGEKSDG